MRTPPPVPCANRVPPPDLRRHSGTGRDRLDCSCTPACGPAGTRAPTSSVRQIAPPWVSPVLGSASLDFPGRCASMFDKLLLLVLAVAAFPLTEQAALTGVNVTGDANGLVIFQGGICNACVASLNITYTNGDPGDLQITTSNGTRLLMDTNIDTGVVTVLLRDLDFPGYGMHDMVITVTKGADTFTGNYVAIVDEPIEGLEVTAGPKVYIHPGDLIEFNVTMTNGTNVFVGVDFGDLVEVTRDCNGQSVLGVVFNFTHNYTTLGTYLVEVVASNYVNKQSYTFQVVVVDYLVVSAAVVNSLVETMEPAVVQLSTTHATPTDMGNLTVLFDCDGSGSEQNVTLATGVAQDFSCTFPTQGNNLTFNMSVTNGLDWYTYVTLINVFDKINVSIDVATEVMVGDPVTLTVLNPPRSGFQYRLGYGQGWIDEETGRDILYTNYTELTLRTPTYDEPTCYNLSFVAYNDFYVAVQYTCLCAFYGIPNSTLQVAPEGIHLRPDDTSVFSILTLSGLSTNNPNNVTCDLDYGDGTLVTGQATTMDFSQGALGLSWTYNYSSTVLAAFKMNCSNAVSQHEYEATIDVRAFDANTFNVTYPKFYIMNDTATVEFLVEMELFGLVKLPRDVQLSWDFGDGSAPQVGPMTAYNKTHTYSGRGNYAFSLTIDHQTPVPTQKVHSDNIRVGTTNLVLTSNFDVGLINDHSFGFTVESFDTSQPVSYTLEFGDSEITDTTSTASVAKSHVYTQAGLYYPVLTAFTPRGTEITTLQTMIIIENPVRGLMLETPPASVLGADVELILTLNDTFLPLTNLTCFFHAQAEGLEIPPNEHFVSLTPGGEPLTSVLTLDVLGDVLVYGNCSNRLSRQDFNATVLVFSACFSSAYIFDRAYRYASSPLVALINNPPVLSSRVEMTCPNATLALRWKIFNVTEEERPIEFNYSISTRLVMANFPALLKPGLYRVELTLGVVAGDSLTDRIHVRLLMPSLVAAVYGGSTVTLGTTDTVTLDAEKESYAPEIGWGKDNGLTCEWSCYVFTADRTTMDPFLLPTNTDLSYQSRSACNIPTLPSGCVVQVPLSTLTPDVWVLFEVNVTKDTRSAVALKGVLPKSNRPPSIAIICEVNCLKKIAPERIFIAKSNVSCDHCIAGELDSALLVWSVLRLDNATTAWVNDTEWGESFNTKRFDKGISIKGGYFKEGVSYMLDLTVTTSTGKTGTVNYIIDVNLPPYGGTCQLDPIGPGSAALDDFMVRCQDWRDEGYNTQRDFAMDLNRPLSLDVFMEVNGSLVLLHSDVGLSSVPRKLPLCQPDPGTGVECNIIVRVLDTFRAYAETNLTVTLTNPLSVLAGLNLEGLGSTGNGSANSTKTLDDFLEDLSDRTSATLQSNDPVKSATAAATYSTIVNSIVNDPLLGDDLSAVDTMGDTQPVDAASETLLTDLRSVNEQQELITDFMGNMTIVVSESIAQLQTTSSPQVLMTLAQSMASTVATPDYVSESSQITAMEGIESLSSRMLIIVSGTRDAAAAEDLLAVIAAATSAMLNVAAPDLSFLAEDYTGVSPLNDTGALSDGEEGFNLVESQYFKEEATRIKELEYAKRIRNAPMVIAAMTNVFQNVFAIVDKLLTSGSTQTVSQPTFILEATKDTLLNIIDRQNNTETGLVGISFTGVEGMELSSKEDLTLQVNRMLKNIFIEGPLAKLVTNPVVIVELKDANGVPLTQLNPEILQPDPEPALRVTIHPYMRPEDASQMFYQKFIYRDLSETACIRIMPEGNQVAYEVFWRSTLAPMDYAPMYDLRSLPEYIEPEDRADFTVCAPTGSIKRRGVCWVGIKPYVADWIVTISKRKKRAAGNQTAVTTTPAPSSSGTSLSTPFQMELLTLSCFSLDGETHRWNPDDCKLIRDSPNAMTRCVCGRRTKLSNTVTFSLAPNKIDFSTVFSRFDIKSQGAVLGTIALIFVIYALGVIWANWKDRQDVFQWGVTLLSDNFAEDNYFYLITVYTGMVSHGGTRSNISFTLYGDYDETGIRNLTDGVRKELRAGSVMHFLMAVPRHLGQLHYMRIWHDNSGKGNHASWFLNRIEIHDIQTGDRTDFLCGQWLSVEESCLEKTLVVGTKENLKNFRTLFYEHARQHVTDDHLWMSVFLRPVKSHFSRVQRVSCCLAFLFLAMIANAMFYNGEPRKDRVQPYDFEIGPVKFSWSQLYFSFISALITAVPLFIIITMFRKAKLRLKDKKTENDWQVRCLPPYLRKLYLESVELEKVLVVKDIVDDEEGVLPHWCVYIGWILLVLAVLVPGFFVVLYSMQWGKTISEAWLMSFFLSFAESIFMVDPFKIVFLAVVFAMLLKAMKNTRPTEFDLKKISRISYSRGLPTGMRRQITVRSFLSDEELRRAKAKRERDLTMRAAIKDLIYNLLFLWALISICFSNRDPRGFRLIENIRSQLVSPPAPPVFTKDREVKADFTATRDAVKFFEWLNGTMLPYMFPEEDYRGKPMSQLDRLHLTDLVNYRVGPPRLRQVRMPQETCLFPYVGTVKCFKQYSIIDEEDRTFCKSWKKTPCSEKDELIQTFDAWKFNSAIDIFGVPLTGLMAMYGGGGYIADIDVNRPIANEALKELSDFLWIDRHTRAVFVEFTLYCTNVNMFAYVSLMAEFPETGGIMPKPMVYPFRVMQHVGTFGTYILICEVCFLVFLAAWVIAILPSLVKERLNYFKNFWNVVGLVVIAFSIAGVSLYFVRQYYTEDALARFRENNRRFVNFSHIAIWDEIFIYVLGFLVCIASLRVLKVMAYTTKTEAVYTVLKESSKTLPGFSFYIFNVLFCFALMGYVAFGRLDDKYRDPAVTLETLFSGVLGDGKFKPEHGFLTEDVWLQQMYFILFVIMVVLALSNLFLAILLDTMSMLGDPNEKNMDLELTSYIWESFVGVVNRGKAKSGQTPGETPQTEVDKTTDISTTTKDPIFALKSEFK